MSETHSVKAGDVLAGKYRVERVIGEGGMGVVVAAYHLQLDEHVAIKFLLPEVLGNAEAVGRFAREARAAVKIKSEHVARVVDVGTLETGSPYMVMEYLEGQDLGAVIQAGGPLPVADAVEYVLQACEALAEAHALGIIHRDLKPSNLFLTRRADGSACVKVLDFGISKVTSLASSGPDLGMTKTAVAMGSPLYMSPEQMASARDVDARTDIWGLGVSLYELLTGRVPFDADTVPQLCAMVLQKPPPPLRNYRPDTQEGLQEVVFRCLEKSAAQRYANIAEVAQALSPYAPRRAQLSIRRVSKVLGAAGLSSAGAVVPLSEAPASSVNRAAQTSTAFGHTAPGTGSPKRTVVVLATVAVFALGIGAWLLTRSPASPSPESTEPLQPNLATARETTPEASTAGETASSKEAQPAATLEAETGDPSAAGVAKTPTSLGATQKSALPSQAKPSARSRPDSASPSQPKTQRRRASSKSEFSAKTAGKTATTAAAENKPATTSRPAASSKSILDLYGDRK